MIHIFNSKIRISYILLVCILVVALTGQLPRYFTALLFIFIHELTHAFFITCFKGQILSLNILAVGLNIETDVQNLTHKQKIIVFISGPFINLFLALFFCIWNTFNYKDIFLFIININLMFGIFNLIPLSPLDGFNIVKLILEKNIGYIKSIYKLKRISKILGLILLLSGFVQIYINKNFSLLFICMYFYSKPNDLNEEAAFMNAKSFAYRRSRLIKKGIYEARNLVVLEDTTLGEAFKNMDFDRFHIIYILDKDLNVVKQMTENQLLELITEDGYNSKFSKYI